MSQRKVRARDVDRDVAIEIVEAAWADGQLTRDEYEQRVDRLLQASTLADLERDILDLQPEGVVWRPRPSSATTTPAPPVRREPTTPSTKLSVLTGLVLAGVGVAALAFVVRPGSASSPNAPTPKSAKTSASLLTPEAFNLAREALDEHTGSDTVYTAMLTSEALSVIRPTTAAGTDAVKTTWDGEWGADEPVTATGERLSLGLVGADAVSAVLADVSKQAGDDANPTLVFKIERHGNRRVCITATASGTTPWTGTYDCRGQKVER